MKQIALLGVLAFILPASASAASVATSTYYESQSVLVATTSPANMYALGGSVIVAAPVKGDESLFGGSVVSTAPVMGDALLVGGSLSLGGSVTGDARLFGGTVSVKAPIDGDLVAVGGSVTSEGAARNTLVVGTEVTLTGGGDGPVLVYGNNVLLGGTFTGDVRVIASGRVSLAEGTVINGMLSYESPEQARIPDAALIQGGVDYTGASYLPASEQSRALLLASFGVFLLIRFMAAIILAGLLAGLFPRLAEAVSMRAFSKRTRSVLLTILLGFAILVATPVLLALLALTFVGLGLTFLIGAAYILLTIVAYVFAGILVGTFLARVISKRSTVLWRDGAVGMLILSFFSLIPYIGFVGFAVLMAFSEGALTALFFEKFFAHEAEEVTLL